MFVTRTGSYSPLFLIVSGFQFCAGMAYQRLVSVETLVDPRGGGVTVDPRGGGVTVCTAEA